MIGRGLLFCIVLLVVAPAFAASRDVITVPAAEKRVALVIGNSAYNTKSLPFLKNPVNDADDITAELKRFGFKVLEKKNVGKKDADAAVAEFGRMAADADVALFYFSGHGIQIKSRNYLLPVDADPKDEAGIPYMSIDVNYPLAEMDDAHSKVNIVMLDACRDNTLSGQFRSGGARGLAAPSDVPKGTVIIYATEPGNVASDGTDRNGAFTSGVLAGLKGNDLSLDGVLTTASLVVDQQTHGAQTPYINGPKLLQKNFMFGHSTAQQVATLPPSNAPIAPAPAPPVFDPAMAELSFWDAIKTSTDPSDFKAYLEQYPKGRFAALARNRAAPKPVVVTSDPNAPVQQQVAVNQPVSPNLVKPSPSATPRTPGTKFKECPECPEMIVIPAGNFTMGSPSGEAGRSKNEGPLHQVTIARPFAVAINDVTRDEYGTFARETNRSGGNCYIFTGLSVAQHADGDWRNPGIQQTDHDPAVCISWNDAQAYISWLNGKLRQTLQVSSGSNGSFGPYRLLSEAEWEYAARAGTTTAYYWGNDAGSNHANCSRCDTRWGGHGTSPVGSFAANSFGLNDMAGNAEQWTEDCFHDSYTGAPTDGSPWTSGDCIYHVLRGGSWYENQLTLRSAYRGNNFPDRRFSIFGFRLARTLD